MARRLTSAELVGRADAVRRIRDAVDDAKVGRPRHLLVGGEAGVGKTRLLMATGEQATSEGARVLTGGCVSVGDAGLPFAPFAEILRTLVAEDGAVEVAAIAGSATADLARFVPALGGEMASPIQEQWAQTRLYEALLELFGRLASRAPLILQLEDLHWADAGTLAATAFLLRSIRDEPIVVAATYRVDEVTRRHPLRSWLAEVSRSDRVERIDLHPLTPAEAAILVANITGETPSEVAVEGIHRRSDGNPFFVEELLAAGAMTESLLPSTLRDVLLRRVDALPASAQELLGVAAIGGRDVDHAELMALAGDPPSAASDLREIVEAGLLLPESSPAHDGYRFRHALLQEAIYDDMLPTDRRRLHRAWGEQLARRGDAARSDPRHLVESAHHWRDAGDPRALEVSIAAGDAAMAGYSFDVAAREYEAALRLWETGGPDERSADIDHVELLSRAADAWYLAKADRQALAACRAAIEELGGSDPARGCRLRVRLGRILWVMGEWAASTDAYEEALASAPAEPPDVRTRALSGLAQVYMLNGRFERSRQLCEEAVRTARAIGARDLESHALNTLGVDLAAIGRIDAGLAAMADSLAIASELGVADDIGRAHVNRVDILAWAGEHGRAVDAGVEGIEATRRLGMVMTYGTYVRYGVVRSAFLAGRWTEAAEHLAEADRTLPPNDASALYRDIYALGYVAARGDADTSAQWTRTRERLRTMPPAEHSIMAYIAAIELAAMDERHEDAAADTLEALELLDRIDGWIATSDLARAAAWSLAELGRRARADGDRATLREAEAHYGEIERRVAAAPGELGEPDGRLGRVLALEQAQVAAHRGRLDGSDDPTPWAALADGWREVEQPYRAAEADWFAAQAAEAVGDAKAAAKHLRAAHEEAIRLGAAPLLGHLETLARRLRVRLGGPSAGASSSDGAPYGLTRREREVLRLVAVGRTNKQIAAELFISESTAGVHVSNILGKLGVATRTEAASVAHGDGIV